MSLISETAAPAIARHTRNPPRGRGRRSTPAHLQRQRWKRGEWGGSSTSPVGMLYLEKGTYHIFCYHIKKGNWHRTIWIYKLSQKWEPVIFLCPGQPWAPLALVTQAPGIFVGGHCSDSVESWSQLTWSWRVDLLSALHALMLRSTTAALSLPGR